MTRPRPALDLRKSLQGGLIVAPGCHDALSARIASHLGFDSVFVSGYSLTAAFMARPDAGYMGLSDLTTTVPHIVRAAGSTPVAVDVDTGFGNVNNVAATTEAMLAMGVAGVLIDDEEMPERCPWLNIPGVLIPVEEMQLKIETIKGIAGEDLVIMVRPSTIGSQYDKGGDSYCQAGLERGAAYAAAGAEVVMAQVRSRDQLLAYGKEWEARGLSEVALSAVWDANHISPDIADYETAGVRYLMPVTPIIGGVAAFLRDAMVGMQKGNLPAVSMASEEFLGILGIEELRDRVNRVSTGKGD